jgi:hypothetical protein
LRDEVEYFLNVGMEEGAKRSRWCFDFEIWYWDWDTYSRQFDKTVDRVSLFFPAGAGVMAERPFWTTDRLDCIMRKISFFLS